LFPFSLDLLHFFHSFFLVDGGRVTWQEQYIHVFLLVLMSFFKYKILPKERLRTLITLSFSVLLFLHIAKARVKRA
jgi:hypothetical protein